MKVRFYKDELYPILLETTNKDYRAIDVPAVTLQRWRRAKKKFYDTQDEIHSEIRRQTGGEVKI